MVVDLYTQYKDAGIYLERKGFKFACNRFVDLNDDQPFIMYASNGFIMTPETEDHLNKLKAEGKLVFQVACLNERLFNEKFVELVNQVKEKLGSITLADSVYISNPDKDNIKSLITRTRKSETEAELKARGVELQSIIDGYEDKVNDTEREDLQDKFQSIIEYLELAQQELEKGDKPGCIHELEESLTF